MTDRRELPPEFIRQLEALEASFLAKDDPIHQSGFGGGPERWRAEREPILNAIEADGDLLDIGCANGYLLECLVAWARDRGLTLVPYGLDRGAGLIDLARARLPGFAANLFVGNVWNWTPARQFENVYMLYDCVPLDYLAEQIHRLLRDVVAPRGRLILGAYGSRSRSTAPFDIAGFLRREGHDVAGTASGGDPPITTFVWIIRPNLSDR